jgi:hypothetical protein
MSAHQALALPLPAAPNQALASSIVGAPRMKGRKCAVPATVGLQHQCHGEEAIEEAGREARVVARIVSGTRARGSFSITQFADTTLASILRDMRALAKIGA